MTLTHEKHGSVWIAAPAGRVDTVTSPSLEDALAGAIARGEHRIVLDCAGVDYVSSAGLRVLLVTAKRLREAGGRFVLCGLTPPVRQVFELAGFMPLFAIEPSRAAAVARAASAS